MTLSQPPSPLRVVVIDDDTELTAMISEWLQRESMQILCFATAREGVAALENDPPDILVLDVMLPDGNGLDLCRQLRASGNTIPILMLTARGDPMDRVLGLEMGSDDYLSKPFEPRELTARIRALARRSRASQRGWRLSFDGMRIDLLARRVLCGNAPLSLTSTEFKLLVALADAAGRPLDRERLSNAIQPGNYLPQVRAVDVQVARLRKKLPPAPHGGEWIETVRGEGYVFTGNTR